MDSHARVVRASATLRCDPDYVLGGILDVAGFAVQAVLSVDLQSLIAHLGLKELINPGWTVARLRACIVDEVYFQGNARILEPLSVR